jgi:type I restriction enzyme M protein
MTKKRHDEEEQPDVFMYPCRFVGIDDPSRQRMLPGDEKIRLSAKAEILEVVTEYKKHTQGDSSEKYRVPAHKIQDRLDVKHCLMNLGSSVPIWKKKGLTTMSLSELVEIKRFKKEDRIISASHERTVQYLRVRYDGGAEPGDEVDPAETTYPHMFRVHKGDIVISNIAATYGSVAVVDEVADGCVVTTEYTVLVARKGHDPLAIWTLMRTNEARADMLLAATGANRTRVKWDDIKEIKIPYPKIEEAKKFAETLRKLEKNEKELRRKKQSVIDTFSESLLLNGAEAEKILQAFKPPK